MKRQLAALLFVIASHAANAQVLLPPEDLAREVLQAALASLPRAICDEGKPCAPATEEEKKNPPISIEETQRIMDRAVFSAVGEYCGADWQRRSFLPMMRYWRHTVKKNERQMALIGLIHGLMQGQAVSAFATKGPCDAELKKKVEAELTFKP